MARYATANEPFNETEKEKLECFFQELYDHVKEKDIIHRFHDRTIETEKLVDAIFKEINDSGEKLFTVRKRLTTGSTYDGTTTGRISDFDFVGLLDIPASSLGFRKGLGSKSCQIIVRDVNLRKYFQEASEKYNFSVISEDFFLLNDVRYLFHKMVENAVEKIKGNGYRSQEFIGIDHIFLRAQGSAPCATITGAGRDIDVTFGLETDYKGIDGIHKSDPDYGKCILVPKGPEGQPQEWAMSFSEQEKQRISSMKESHRKILTILKVIISIFKSSTGFDFSICSSYVVKTIVYHHDVNCKSNKILGEIDADCIVDIVAEIERIYLLDFLKKNGGLKFLIQFCAVSYFYKRVNPEDSDIWFLFYNFYMKCASELYSGKAHLPDFHPTFLEEKWHSIPAATPITTINIDTVREEVAKIVPLVQSDASRLEYLKKMLGIVQVHLPYIEDARVYVYRVFALFICGIKNITSVYGPSVNVVAVMPYNPCTDDDFLRDLWCIGVVYAHQVATSLRKLINYICRASDKEIKIAEHNYKFDKECQGPMGRWFKIIPTLSTNRPPEILDVFQYVLSRIEL